MTDKNDAQNQSLAMRPRPQGVFWLTGLSSSGKTTLATECKKALLGINPELEIEILDGDEIRKLFKFNGFSKEDRMEQMRRVAEIACYLESKERLVLVALISPYEAGRAQARLLIQNFHEIYLSTPLEVCKSRDVKGLYAKAARGEILNFTGVSDVYEAPKNAELNINTGTTNLKDSVQKLVDYVLKSTKGR